MGRHLCCRLLKTHQDPQPLCLLHRRRLGTVPRRVAELVRDVGQRVELAQRDNVRSGGEPRQSEQALEEDGPGHEDGSVAFAWCEATWELREGVE